MKSITKKVEVTQEEDAQKKASKFTKFKKECEHIFKATKEKVKVGLGVVGLGVMLTFSSCGDAATTQGPTDAIVETADVAKDATTDSGNIEDIGNTPKSYAENWSNKAPEGYVDVCNTQPISGSSDKLWLLLNEVCNNLDINGREEFFISSNEEYGLPSLVFTDIDGKPRGYSLRKNNYFTKTITGPLEGICTYSAIINPQGDEKALNTPSIFFELLNTQGDKGAIVTCNIGCIGKYTTEKAGYTGERYTCTDKNGGVLMRIAKIPYQEYDQRISRYVIEYLCC